MSNDRAIQEALFNHATDKFKLEFGFEFGGTPPDVMQGPDPSVSWNHYLFREVDESKLMDHINHTFMSGLNIPQPIVRNEVTASLFQQAKSMMRDGPMRSWTWANVDQTYHPPDPISPPFYGTGFAACWREDKYCFIFFLLEVYEGRYPDDILNEELIKRLTNDLRRRINNHPKENNSLMEGFADLKECILNYSSQEFAKSFGFEYSKNAKPPQTRPGGKVAIHDALFNFREFPATKDNVKSWIDAELFDRNSKRFPEFVMGEIYDNILGRVLSCGSVGGSPNPNDWRVTANRQVYYDLSPRKQDIQQFSQYVFVHGDLTLDLPHNGGKGRTERTFVLYRGVFSTFSQGS